jgi:hypothetical protein
MKPSLPLILLFAGTRVALGIGIGLLIAGRLDRSKRRNLGLALAIGGGASTVPFAINFRNLRRGAAIPISSAA